MTSYLLSGGIKVRAAERHVVAATMVPALHDVPAWRIRVVPGLIRVEADPRRFRTTEDPDGRSVHIGCGAALLNLRLAAAQLGREPVVRLLPDQAAPTLLATVRLAGPHRTAPFERLLYATTLRPVPLPAQSVDRPPARSVLNELVEAARVEGTTLALTVIPEGQAGPNGTLTAALSTRGDGPQAWLRTGQAVQRVILTAAARAVAASVSGEFPDKESGRLPEHGDFHQLTLRLTRSTTH